MKTNTPYGLALCGGKSSRMGEDKSRLSYHGHEQRYHAYYLLSAFCRETFISCNASQSASIDGAFQVLEDHPDFAGAGPIAGILTAFRTFPERDFIVTGCDYPLLNKEDIRSFLQTIQPNSIAHAFYDEADRLYQPVLAWYSAVCGPKLLDRFQNREYSLQGFLRSINAGKFTPPPGSMAMLSVDTPQSRADVLGRIGKQI